MPRCILNALTGCPYRKPQTGFRAPAALNESATQNEPNATYPARVSGMLGFLVEGPSSSTHRDRGDPRDSRIRSHPSREELRNARERF
jgi:hypothetical protein